MPLARGLGLLPLVEGLDLVALVGEQCLEEERHHGD